jgi:putative transposase
MAALLESGGYQVGVKKVPRLMKQDTLLAQRRKKYLVMTDSQHPFTVYPNLAQYLNLNDINQLWVADITYIRLLKEFVYLAVVLDAFSRRAVGWALGRIYTPVCLWLRWKTQSRNGNRNLDWCTIPTVARNTPATIT